MGSTGNADGSDGRIAIYYSTSFSGTANNAYLRNMSEEQVDSIFLDGLESGDLSAWSSAQTDGGDLMTSQSADYWGDYGLAASINDTNAIYVQDDTPDGEGTFHARFYIHPDGINMGATDILPIFEGLDSGGSPVMKVEINNPSGSAFQVRVNVLEGSTWVPGAWQSLPGGWTAIEIDYKTTHELGFIKLYINGMEAGSVNNINNPDNQLHSVRMGAVSEPSGTTSGVLYFDDYESRRYSMIGLLPERGVEDPEAVQEAGWTERAYSYQRSQPFAVQQVTTEEGTSTYDYDANGNMTTRVENGVSWTHTYNAENRLSSMTNGVTTWLFSYDGDATLVGQLVTDNVTATHTAFYMGGGYEVISDGVTETVRKYYALAAPLAALGGAPLRYASHTFGMSDNGVMKYLISDHLGSTVAITDSTGNVLAETRYMPFGEPRADAGSLAGTDKTYTGQRDVLDTGLLDYKARNYSPWLGRFIQPDTIVPGAGNSQAWNRYAYVGNNPVAFSDPSGHIRVAEGSEYASNRHQIELRNDYKISTTSTNNVKFSDKSKSITPTPDIPALLGTPTSSCKGAPCIRTATPTPTSTPTPELYFNPSQYTVTPTNTFTPTYIPTFTNEEISRGLSGASRIVDLAEYVKIINNPALSFGIDLASMSYQDRDSGFSDGHKIIRAVVVGFEGSAVTIVATGSATAAVGISSETGPFAIPIAIATFASVAYLGSVAMDQLNDRYVFPAIGEYFNER